MTRNLTDYLTELLAKRLSQSEFPAREDFSVHIERLARLGRQLGWDRYLERSTNITIPCEHIEAAVLFLILEAVSSSVYELSIEAMAAAAACKAGSVGSVLSRLHGPVGKVGYKIVRQKDRLFLEPVKTGNG